MAKHAHRPERDSVGNEVRQLTHSGMKYRCAECGYFIVWIRERPNRQGHWRIG